jgi:hypothetical protein
MRLTLRIHLDAGSARSTRDEAGNGAGDPKERRLLPEDSMKLHSLLWALRATLVLGGMSAQVAATDVNLEYVNNCFDDKAGFRFQIPANYIPTASYFAVDYDHNGNFSEQGWPQQPALKPLPMLNSNAMDFIYNGSLGKQIYKRSVVHAGFSVAQQTVGIPIARWLKSTNQLGGYETDNACFPMLFSIQVHADGKTMTPTSPPLRHEIPSDGFTVDQAVAEFYMDAQPLTTLNGFTKRNPVATVGLEFPRQFKPRDSREIHVSAPVNARFAVVFLSMTGTQPGQLARTWSQFSTRPAGKRRSSGGSGWERSCWSSLSAEP